MQRIFGYFKQKITQATQQNKQQLQTIATAIAQTATTAPSSVTSVFTDPESEYSSQRTLHRLQQMKNSYMKWNILIANEASTGLFMVQTHNRSVILKKIKANIGHSQNLQKSMISLEQIRKTKQQLKEMNQLSGKWVGNLSQTIEKIIINQNNKSLVKRQQGERNFDRQQLRLV